MINKISQQIQDFKKNGLVSIEIKVKNRLALPRVKRAINQPGTGDILIVNGAEKSVSEIHRVTHLEDKLRILNIPHLTITKNMLNLIDPQTLAKFQLLYIHRSGSSLKILGLIKIFKTASKTIIYDVDDLIFDQDQIASLDFLKHGTANFKKSFLNETKDILMMMKLANYIITPTQFLANYISEKFSLKTFVLRNHLDQKNLEIGKAIFKQNISRKPGKTLTIAYFPGTKTHQRDFHSISEALTKCLQEIPTLKLKIVGELDLNKDWQAFTGQISKVKRRPYAKLMQEFRDVDISLAPLEMNNDFCEGKSELKYIFAGAAGVPTIASATDAYQFAIENKRNGLLCKSDHDWYLALKQLLSDDDLRKDMGKAAYEHCQSYYSPINQAGLLKKILRNIHFTKYDA